MKYVDNWSLDPCEREIIRKNISSYLYQFNKSDANLVKKILEKITVINVNKFDSQVRKFKDNITQFMIEHKELGIFCVIDNLHKPHHSYGLLQHFSGTPNFKSSIYLKENSDYEFNKYKEILLVDDYSGSGNSICKAIKIINENSPIKKKVYVSCLYMTNSAKNNILNFVRDNASEKIDIAIVESWIQFRRDFIKECCLFNEIEITQFEKLCTAICEVKKDSIYGYESIGDGISFVNWTPNTTIKMLWKDGKKYVALFSRKDYPFNNKKFWKKVNVDKLKNLAINRVKYLDASVALMLVIGYSYGEIIRMNSITKEKLESIITSLCVQNYIKCVEYDNDKIFYEGLNYFKLIDKQKYYKFIHGVSIEKTVKTNLICAINNKS